MVSGDVTADAGLCTLNVTPDHHTYLPVWPKVCGHLTITPTCTVKHRWSPDHYNYLPVWRKVCGHLTIITTYLYSQKLCGHLTITPTCKVKNM